MKEHIPVGMNRTGMQMSPFEASAMQAAPGAEAESTPGNEESSIAEVRWYSIEQAEPLGSVPVHGTMTGALATGMTMLTSKQPQLLLDKLGERLAFERSGTRLYDALIAKFETIGGPDAMTVEDLDNIREEEASHFALVANAIDSIGGDPTSQTPGADLVGVESAGLLQVVTDPRTTMAQSLHAILVAEMTDLAGWKMLVALAEDQGHDALAAGFRMALDEERVHLQLVRSWFEQATMGGSTRGAGILDDEDDDGDTILH